MKKQLQLTKEGERALGGMIDLKMTTPAESDTRRKLMTTVAAYLSLQHEGYIPERNHRVAGGYMHPDVHRAYSNPQSSLHL